MDSYAAFLDRYEARAEPREASLRDIVNAVERALIGLSSPPLIESRVKLSLSLWRKMRRYGLELDEVHDLLGVRVVVETVPQCYEVVERLRSLWPNGWIRVKDYVTSPKSNGYRSLHIWLALPMTARLEVQIRTRQMHRDCLTGTASHHRYKRQDQRRCSPRPIQIVAQPMR